MAEQDMVSSMYMDTRMDDVEQLAEVFKALGDVTRLRILALLAEKGELCVCEIVPALEAPQSTVSHHLATLKYAGLVRQRRESQMIFYSLTPGRQLRAALDALEMLSAKVQSGLAAAAREGRGRTAKK